MIRSEAEPGALRIGAGLLHYRFWPGVRSTIDALLGQSRQPDVLFVIDHASGDGSADEIRAAYPQLEVIELTDNQGPAGGMGRLLSTMLERNVDAIFILVDDFELAPDALEQLAARLGQNPHLGAVGPLLAHQREPETIFYAGGYIDPRTWDIELTEHPKRLSDWQGKPPHSVEFLLLSGILVRSEAARCATVPAHFYHHLDDADFTLQLGSQGWGLECVPAAVAWQDLGDRDRSTLLVGPPPYLAIRNKLGLVARNAPRRMLVRELLRVVSWMVRDAIRPRSGSRADLTPRLRALIDFCRGRWGAPP